MLVAAILSSYVPNLHSAFSPKTLLTILAPASLVFLLGLYDDLYTVGPYTKFAVQALAATMLFVGGLRILNIPVLFGEHALPWFVGLPFTILWVLAITNAFNLIDGLDGLAAGSALFSTLVVFVVALLSGYALVTPHDHRSGRRDLGLFALQLQSRNHLPRRSPAASSSDFS